MRINKIIDFVTDKNRNVAVLSNASAETSAGEITLNTNGIFKMLIIEYDGTLGRKIILRRGLTLKYSDLVGKAIIKNPNKLEFHRDVLIQKHAIEKIKHIKLIGFTGEYIVINVIDKQKEIKIGRDEKVVGTDNTELKSNRFEEFK
tara:strand:- start:199 stop:636 length:438 start_codon:yes stop_codon:yes gene_type:complete